MRKVSLCYTPVNSELAEQARLQNRTSLISIAAVAADTLKAATAKVMLVNWLSVSSENNRNLACDRGDKVKFVWGRPWMKNQTCAEVAGSWGDEFDADGCDDIYDMQLESHFVACPNVTRGVDVVSPAGSSSPQEDDADTPGKGTTTSTTRGALTVPRPTALVKRRAAYGVFSFSCSTMGTRFFASSSNCHTGRKLQVIVTDSSKTEKLRKQNNTQLKQFFNKPYESSLAEFMIQFWIDFQFRGGYFMSVRQAETALALLLHSLEPHIPWTCSDWVPAHLNTVSYCKAVVEELVGQTYLAFQPSPDFRTALYYFGTSLKSAAAAGAGMNQERQCAGYAGQAEVLVLLGKRVEAMNSFDKACLQCGTIKSLTMRKLLDFYAIKHELLPCFNDCTVQALAERGMERSTATCLAGPPGAIFQTSTTSTSTTTSTTFTPVGNATLYTKSPLGEHVQREKWIGDLEFWMITPLLGGLFLFCIGRILDDHAVVGGTLSVLHR